MVFDFEKLVQEVTAPKPKPQPPKDSIRKKLLMTVGWVALLATIGFSIGVVPVLLRGQQSGCVVGK